MKTIRIAEPNISATDIDAVMKCLKETQLSGRSPIVKEFEQAFAKRVGRRFAIAVNSGTSALFLSLKGLGIKSGDEVIVPDFAFIAVPNAVSHTGAIPKLTDVEPFTYNLNANKIVITPKTKAIIVVHTYGHPANWDKIREKAYLYNIPIIEDAAEALGATYNGRPIGSLGMVSCFSFFANKTMTTGEGGMVVTDNEELYREMYLLKDQYRTTGYTHDGIGYNLNMGAMQAALGLSQLSRLDEFLAKKAHIAKRYRTELGICPIVMDYATHSWWMYAIEAKFELQGVELRPEFLPIHKQKPYLQDGDFKISERIKLTCLPISTTMTDDEQTFIIKQIKRAIVD